MSISRLTTLKIMFRGMYACGLFRRISQVGSPFLLLSPKEKNVDVCSPREKGGNGLVPFSHCPITSANIHVISKGTLVFKAW
jgi:hypothetical protein